MLVIPDYLCSACGMHRMCSLTEKNIEDYENNVKPFCDKTRILHEVFKTSWDHKTGTITLTPVTLTIKEKK